MKNTHYNKTKKQKAFTLIELLVVISIIGLLSTLAVVALTNAQKKSRDTKRRSDLKQISTALELYFDSNNGYPSTSGNWWGNCSGYGSHPTSGSNGWVPNLAPTYMGVLPLDPKPNGAGGCYLYRSNGTDYKMLTNTTVESISAVPSTDPMYDPYPRSTSLTIYTPGARTW
jgi:prepilin-type N-terminal cleavage/methylation domain-containing protein